MFYITVENDIITDFFCSSGKPENNYIEVPEKFEGKKGDNINLFNDKFEIRPFKELIDEGLLTLKGNQKLDGNYIIEKPLQEQVDDGFLILENYQKIENNQIVNKSLDELFSDKVIPELEYKEKKASIIRSERNSIINSLAWIRQRHIDEQLIGNTTLTEEQYKIYLKYIQKLRDITKQTKFPLEVIWPMKPDFI